MHITYMVCEDKIPSYYQDMVGKPIHYKDKNVGEVIKVYSENNYIFAVGDIQDEYAEYFMPSQLKLSSKGE